MLLWKSKTRQLATRNWTSTCRVPVWLLCGLWLVGSGASCPRLVGRGGSLAGPVVLAPGATLEQILAVVNQPAQRIQQLRTVGGRLLVDGSPSLAAEVAMERPRNLRVTAKLGVALSGEPEVDLGSNYDAYWMWIRREETLYVGRHDERPTGEAGQFLPVPPAWLLEVLGLVALTPADIVAGPTPLGEDRVSLQTRLTGRPDVVRVLEIDAQRGYIVRQHLYDEQRNLLASSEASQFRFMPEHAVSLPHYVEIQMPLVQSRLVVEATAYLINQLPQDTQTLWQMPSVPGAQRIPLTGGAIFGSSPANPASVPPAMARPHVTNSVSHVAPGVASPSDGLRALPATGAPGLVSVPPRRVGAGDIRSYGASPSSSWPVQSTRPTNMPTGPLSDPRLPQRLPQPQ